MSIDPGTNENFYDPRFDKKTLKFCDRCKAMKSRSHIKKCKKRGKL